MPTMPRSWQYPRWRRILLQATLWLVLAAAVGLAALVSRQRLQSQRIDLTHRVTLSTLTIMLPANWITVPDVDNLGLIANEPQDSDQQRSLTIRLLPATPALAMTLLLQNGLSTDAPDPLQLDSQSPPLEQDHNPVPVAGTTGILQKSLRAYTSPASETDQVIREELVVIALLPTHQALIIHLTCPPEEDAQNTTLIRRLAAAITINKRNCPIDKSP
jgi:hypothetical protein